MPQNTFSILQEDSNKGSCLTTAPSNWVVKGGYAKRSGPSGLTTGLRNAVAETDLLYWPILRKNYTNLRTVADSQPQSDWRQLCCILKRENIASFELAEVELSRMESDCDTEEESRALINSLDRAEQSRKVTLPTFQFNLPPSPLNTDTATLGKSPDSSGYSTEKLNRTASRASLGTSGTNAVYHFVDLIFTRKFMMLGSWTGSTKSSDSGAAVKSLSEASIASRIFSWT